RYRRQVLERLDGLLAALGIPRAQRRRQDLLEQRRLAVGRGPEDAQVASADAEARQLADGADDLLVGVVVERLPVVLLAADDPVLLELADERALGAGLLEHLLEPVERADALHGNRRPARPRLRSRADRIARAPRRQLLADDAQRQELVALQAQDGPQALDVRLGVEAVAALRPARLEQLLVLEVADLRDRDVGELALELLADGADRQRLARARRRRRADFLAVACAELGVHRSRKVSLYLPTCSSSPSVSRCDSIRRRLT